MDVAFEDEAAATLAAFKAAGIDIATCSFNDPTLPVPAKKMTDRRWLISAARRRLFVEEFAKTLDLQATCRIVGWSKTAYAQNRVKDPRFAAEVDALRGGRMGRPKVKVIADTRVTDARVYEAQAAARIAELLGTQPPDSFELPDESQIAEAGGFAGFRKVFFGMDTPWFHQLIVEALEGSEPGTITMVLLPPEHGKGLSLDTPLPTPTGWTTMGDIAIGDRLFDERGEPCNVAYVSPVHHRPCYRVTFSDGSSIVCDDEHLWTVRDRSRGYRTVTAQTSELTDRVTVTGRLNLATPVHAGMRLEEAALPVDPYTLGAWLGDGFSSSGMICFGSGDDHIQHIPYPVAAVRAERSNCVSVRFDGLLGDLRMAGVLRNKHIPAAYLRASEKQRLALLQGLMDTDGSCSTRGQCEFTTTCEALAVGAEELVRSLGFKVRRYSGRATLYGKDCGPKYRLSFYPRSDRPVFRLARKVERQLTAAVANDREAWQIIESIEPVESVPTRCIQVDSPSALYVAGRQQIVTHNTTLLEDWLGYKYGTNPEFRAIYASERQHHSRKIIKRLKNRMHPDGPAREYVRRFGPFVPQTGDDAHPQAWNQDYFDVWRRSETDERDYNLVGLGFGSAVAGTRCDLLVLDDVQSLKSINLTDKLVEEFRQDWLSRPGAQGRTVILGTRVGEDDFYQRLMELELVDHLVKFPAHDGRGRWLWPERYTPENYERMRRNVGESAWARNYMQRPSASGERTFTEADIAKAAEAGRLVRFGFNPDGMGIRSAVVGWDPGFGVNAFFVGGILNDRFVALDWRTDLGLTSTGQMAQILHDMCDHWMGQGVRVSHLVIEDKAFQHGLLTDEAVREVQNRYGFSISGHQTTGQSKLDDDLGIAAMARSFRLGEMVLPGSDDPDTVRARAQLDAELARWRPNKRGAKLQQDLVMAAWFAWMRWRNVRAMASEDDRSHVIRMSTPFRRPTTFRPMTRPSRAS